MSHHLVGVLVVAGAMLSLLVLVRKQVTVTFVMISVVAIIIGYWGWRIIGSEDQDLAAIQRDAETARAKQDAAIRHDFETDPARTKQIGELQNSLQQERARADQLKRDVATVRLHAVGQSHQKLILAISRRQERERADQLARALMASRHDVENLSALAVTLSNIAVRNKKAADACVADSHY
jgi:hypothetical protein